jgi:hypothetical protein
MVKFLKENGYIIYLGMILSIVDCTIFNWEFLMILLPTAILAEWKSSN